VQFGVLQFFSWPNRRFPLPEVYQRAFDRIDVMEHSGYDAVWLAEHHFSTYSVCPSIHMMGAHIAARTKRLRIGTAVSLAPFYQPLRLAEEIALLDVLSDGRVNFGAGRGFDAIEYRNFGVARDDSYPMFREHVRVVLEAWRNERLTFHGRYCHFDDVEVLPKPLQQPHPPVWLASTSEDAVIWSAQNGYSILMDPHSSHAQIAAKRARYQDELERAGHSMANRVIPMARNIALAETDAKAHEVAKSSAQFMFGSYLKNAPRPDGDDGLDPIERYVADTVICGTPESVVDQLHALEEQLPLEYLMCTPLSHESFVLFTEKVMPRFL
jgi:alkanesulfonate monooxygenase SsuD/methylene tetrahydromethanopterin reductase-like flavin-dependent oxidoreductase (luciferase family)